MNQTKAIALHEPDPNGKGNGKLVTSSLVSRNIMIGGRRTSIRLEIEMWEALRDICHKDNTSLAALCTKLAQERPDIGSFTSAVRVYVVRRLRAWLRENTVRRAVQDAPAPELCQDRQA